MGARSGEDVLLGGDLLGRGRSRVELVSQLQHTELPGVNVRSGHGGARSRSNGHP